MKLPRRTFCASTFLTAMSGATIARAATTKLRVGQIGTKHPHAQGKLEAMLRLSDRLDFVGIVEPDEQQRKRVQEQATYQNVKFLSEADLLSTPGLQMVAIETDAESLVETGSRAVAAGKHIHLDKPGGRSIEAFRRMMHTAEQQELIVQMGYMLRYNVAFQFMYRAVKEGWLGQIRELDASMGKFASQSVRQEMSWHPGGGMLELGGHLIDSVVYLLGRPNRVTGFTKRTQSDHIADNQLAVFETADAIATVRINNRDPFGFPRRCFNIVGENGALEIAPLEGGNVKLMLKESAGDYTQGTHKISLPKSGGRYDGEFLDFANVLAGKSSFAWSKQHDIDTHEALLAACK